MKAFDITDVTDLEVAAAESEQDRRDHAKLKARVDDLLKHEDAMRVPMAVQRLVDGEVDPVVVAKTLLIGNRDGNVLYRISTRTHTLTQDESAAETWIQIAVRDMDPDLAATYMISGAVWLALQFRIDRELLAGLVIAAEHRQRHPDRAGYGVVDFVDSHGVGKRADIVTAIKLAKLPDFAPLEYVRR